MCVLFHRTTKLGVTTHVCTGTEVEQGRQKGFETQQPRYQAGAKGATCDLDEMVGRTGCPEFISYKRTLNLKRQGWSNKGRYQKKREKKREVGGLGGVLVFFVTKWCIYGCGGVFSM